MKTYRVGLTRIYAVTIEAESEDEAQHYAEFFLGNCPDLSTEQEKNKHNFSIERIKMIYNDATSIENFE